MDKKGWLGADLIFDLDADHIEGAEKMAFPKMLAKVKVEFTKLVEEFILGDLGFDPAKVEVVFSGGRGYHAHISDERVLRLTSHERREIVDYISGTGLNFDWALPKEPYEVKKFKGHVNIKYRRLLPLRESGGWRGKLLKGIGAMQRELDAMERAEAIDYFTSVSGIGSKTAERLYDELFAAKPGARGIDRMIAENKAEVFSDEKLLNAFIKIVKDKVKLDLEGEADEPVTSDVKRLIRLPGTLHAKTGFVTFPMPIEALKSFDPFSDALPPILTDKPFKLKGLKDASFKLRGETFSVKAGDVREYPEYAALFLVCSKNCEPA